ncbi:helix-turn-helix domain-containing protein [Streptomyces sp. NPDC052107]|uniref:AraC-like ligand-binding domain-containing protein n=1 Tax=Streptomyces sp. NPDC052107 TaxID=3155632 RepID=UPI0034451B76
MTEFRTTDLPAAERFGGWHDMTTSALVPNALRSDHEEDFRASVQLLDFKTVKVSALRYPPLETSRTTRLIQRSDPECYQVMVNLCGGHRIVQGGKDITSGPGDLLCYDTSRPWRGWAGDHSLAGVVGVMVQVPRALVPVSARRVEQVSPLLMPATSGMAALFSGYFRQLVAGAAAYRATDDTHLANVTVELLTALLVHHLDAGSAAPDETHRDALLLQIKAFVQEHLGEPRLGPATIAAAHHLSVRSLHRLFGQGTTVAGWIRSRRLECCHRDLANPLLRHLPIRAIGARWGLGEPAHFSRIFRAAYGMSASEYRHLALAGHSRHPSSTARR